MNDAIASMGSELSHFDEVALNEILVTFPTKNPKILEIGSWTGLGSTQFFAEHASHLSCIDTWSGNLIPSHDKVLEKYDPFLLFKENTKQFSEKIIPYKGLSTDIFPLLKGKNSI